MLNFSVDSSSVIANLDNINNNLKLALKNTITNLSIRLTNNIKSGKLTGTVLKVRTGRLRNSIHYRILEDNSGITGLVETNVKYAPIHEYGFNGNVTVKAHMRNIKQAFGRSITPVNVQIRSFTRNVNLPERSFMRSALNDMKPIIMSEIENTVNNIGGNI